MELLRRAFRILLLTMVWVSTAAFATAADLYVTSINEDAPENGQVLRISPDGTVHVFVAPIGDPYGIVVDGGNILVASDPASTVYRYALDTREDFATNLNGPIGIAFDNAGNL